MFQKGEFFNTSYYAKLLCHALRDFVVAVSVVDFFSNNTSSWC